jgi:undecaprenyl pyrophosphate phosphatase UppP
MVKKNKAARQEEWSSREFSSGERYEKYRKEVEKMLDKQIRAIKREKRITYPMWIYITILCTSFLLIGGFTSDPTKKLWFGILACFWLLFGAVFILRYFINYSRLEIMKEIKEIQLKIEELREKIAAKE